MVSETYPLYHIHQVSQYSCSFENLAPVGCTEYFYGSNTGTFESYNYNSGNGLHLVNQQHTFCFRWVFFQILNVLA